MTHPNVQIVNLPTGHSIRAATDKTAHSHISDDTVYTISTDGNGVAHIGDRPLPQRNRGNGHGLAPLPSAVAFSAVACAAFMLALLPPMAVV